jgi:hypothetical protein
MDRNKLKIILGAATAVALIVGVVLLILGIALDISTFPRVLLFIISALCLLLAVELGYFMYLMMDTKPNYFLYSSQAKRNVSVQKLTFSVINSRMNRFLSGYAASEGKLWNDRILDDPYLDMPEEFKPLVAYKMLYGLADKDAEMGWRCLENASEETLAFICKGLELNRDNDFAAAFARIRAQKPVNMQVVRDYLVKNKRYMQSKMTKYVIENIDRF